MGLGVGAGELQRLDVRLALAALVSRCHISLSRRPVTWAHVFVGIVHRAPSYEHVSREGLSVAEDLLSRSVVGGGGGIYTSNDRNANYSLESHVMNCFLTQRSDSLRNRNR